jgi:hypothetical protein
MKRIAILSGLALVLAAPAMSAPQATRSFRNCTAMHRVYPHGVGRFGPRDHTSGTQVTNFKHSDRIYRANRGLDRDHDKIACEKR